MKSAGLFCCQKTGIKFQVTGPVVIVYSPESWSDYFEEIPGSKHEIIGPLFKIKIHEQSMANVVSAVYLPHYLCLRSASSPPEHFVDKHRKALIERLSHVDPVLDDLLAQSLLTQEQYENIRRRKPTQEKMRQLYQYTTSWGYPDKENLYQAILRCNKPLVIDLEGLQIAI
ncbi:hypothetical protein AB205_0009250 [Aquarana catesbeiana]|uniref:CARD domain-containing protein n=1 Tax=Aquarana catesbeiana TaxID=8400 RepID=A0A2G9RZ27_AQUCT|nr:hypothetical protein AB205_0009250 [Aquarana catesbeiana]